MARDVASELRVGRGFEALEQRIFMSVGDLDASFGNGGVVTRPGEIFREVAVQPDGKARGHRRGRELR